LLILFYDGPTPPPGTFDMFTEIKSLTSDQKTRSFSDFVNSIPADSPLQGGRKAFQSITVQKVTVPILEAIQNQILVRNTC